MSWRPLNLQDALDGGENPIANMRQPKTRDNLTQIIGYHPDYPQGSDNEKPIYAQIKVGYQHTRYMCPTCGKWHKASVIVDCRALPIIEDWACDGCWTDWRRHNRIIDGGVAIVEDRKGRLGPRVLGLTEWITRWLTAHSAPQAEIDKIALRKRA